MACVTDTPTSDGEDMGNGVCPFVLDRSIMRQRWERLTFLHWQVDPDAVQSLLPKGLVVETHQDAAWVGLVPFFMHVSTAHGHGAPWVSNFCETNVRTYVRDHEGRSGIWFFSLDASRLGVVGVARSTYRLPYYWSRMRLTRETDEVRYHCTRRWPRPRGTHSDVRIRVGPRFRSDELSDLDHFLTARWVLFSVAGHRIRFVAQRTLAAASCRRCSTSTIV